MFILKAMRRRNWGILSVLFYYPFPTKISFQKEIERREKNPFISVYDTLQFYLPHPKKLTAQKNF